MDGKSQGEQQHAVSKENLRLRSHKKLPAHKERSEVSEAIVRSNKQAGTAIWSEWHMPI